VRVAQLVPAVRTVDVNDVLRELRTAPRAAGPFSAVRIEFSAAVSRAIFRQPRSRAFPETMALAFWLRQTAVQRLAQRFAALETAGPSRVPRGLAFHLPPSNVDTLFVYSLMASFLVGNSNLVRVSRDRLSDQVELLCDVLREVLADDRFGQLANELTVISYGHEPEPTEAVSREADVRLLWGGDDTVERVRSLSTSADTHDLMFGDRFSFAVLRPAAILGADEASRQALAERLFNDAYWFDQLGCASPRLLVWVGDRGDVASAREVLLSELGDVIRYRGYTLEPGAAMTKMTYLYGALIDRRVSRLDQVGNELAVLTLEDLDDFDRTHPGAGLFFEAQVDALDELVGFVRRKDQTVTAHGFSHDELTRFAQSLNGRGVDRIVPFGDALSFGSVWDGYDLLAELTRTITVAPPA
jgi:hypothetical protein